MKTISIETEEEDDDGNRVVVEDYDQEGADMLKIYDTWTKASAALKDTDEELREEVQKQARDFLRVGQEVALEKD